MRFIYFETLNSTQLYLTEMIKHKRLTPPVCVWTQLQTEGIGSRGRRWIGKKGNLFFSFAYEIKHFDAPPQSLSIYFGWIFKATLNETGSKAVMKWPNDIYLLDNKPKKIGGVITNILGDKVVCGIGLNTKFAPSEEFGSLDIDIKNDKILKTFFDNIKLYKWNRVLDEYKEEFEKTKEIFDIEGSLVDDGGIEKNKQRIYSKR